MDGDDRAETERDQSRDLADAPPAEIEAATRRVLDRLVDLFEQLEPTERSVLANLLAPTIRISADVDEVVGFGEPGTALPHTVYAALAESGIQVVDDPD